MALTAAPAEQVRPVHVPLVAWLVVAVALTCLYVMLQENGVLLSNSWMTVHELFHDGRHLVGVPCH